MHRSFRKIDPEKLKAYVTEYPEAYQRELAEKVAAYQEATPDVPSEKIAYVDECGIDTYLYRIFLRC